MAIQDRLLSLAAKVVTTISLKNVAIWTLATLVVLIGFTVFENRAVIVEYIVTGRTIDVPVINSFSVSDASKARINQITDVDDLINSIVVLNADIRNNRRIPIYWYADDGTLQKAIDALFSGRFGGIPLFTSDEKNNESIVGIINGEFACGTFDDGGNSVIFPGLQTRMPYVCRTSLPPYYGQFSGYITITLNRIPTQPELDTLKTETLNLSTEVYFRDVLPTSRKLPVSAPK